MKNQTYVILALIFVIVIAVFAVFNVNPVEVNYLFWKGESPLVFVILFSVLLGGILTTAFGTGKYISLKRENKQLQRKVNHLEETVAKHTEKEIEEALNNERENGEVND